MKTKYPKYLTTGPDFCGEGLVATVYPIRNCEIKIEIWQNFDLTTRKWETPQVFCVGVQHLNAENARLLGEGFLEASKICVQRTHECRPGTEAKTLVARMLEEVAWEKAKIETLPKGIVPRTY